MTLARLRSRLPAAVVLSSTGCGPVDPDPVEFAELTADLRVTPSVLGPGDTAHIHVTFTNPLAALNGLEIPPHGSLSTEDVLTPTFHAIGEGATLSVRRPPPAHAAGSPSR